MRFLLTLTKNLRAWAIGVAVFLAALAGVYLKGKSDGKAFAGAKRSRAQQKARQTARKIENDVDQASADTLRRRASRWVRQRKW